MPDEFKQQVINTFNDNGEDWLQQLPDIINYAINNWQLEDIQPVNNLSYNYVVYGYSKLYEAQIILKMVCDDNEFNYEKMCLLNFQGDGVSKLLDYDIQYNILLLEKIGNGITLKSLFPNNEIDAIESVVKIINKLHKTKISFNSANYPTVFRWIKSIKKFNSQQIDPIFIQLGIKLVDELLYSSEKYTLEYLLHGDLHHENILQSNNGVWVSIDPKGVIGNKAYEVGAFMRNPVPELLQQPNLKTILINRIDRFAELLELDKQLLIKYSYLCTLLAVIWNLEDNGNQWQYWVKLLPVFKSMLVVKGKENFRVLTKR